MDENHDIKERLRRLEDQEMRMNRVITDIEKALDRLAIVVEQMNDLTPRVRELETEMVNQKIVSKAVQWLGITIGGTAVVMIASYLFGAQ